MGSAGPGHWCHRGSATGEFPARRPQRGPWRPLAGGTDVMVQLGAGQLRPGRYVDIWSIAELRGIRVDEAQIEIGALTTYSEIRKHALLATEFPLLQQSARETGAIAIQNRGTIGGNIANASPLSYKRQIILLAHSCPNVNRHPTTYASSLCCLTW